MTAASVELICDTRDVVGESLIWSARDSALWWIDIAGKRISRLEWATRRLDHWATPDIVTSIGLRKRGGFVVGLKREVALWTPGGCFETFARIEPDAPGIRLNEGKVAPDGSLWVGTMENNLTDAMAPIEISGAKGSIWRVGSNGSVARMCEDRFGITNTFVWLDDGRFVTADTLANTLYVYERHADGTLGRRAPFARPHPRGLPDGSCLDVEGYVWNCRVVGGACVVRFAPDGSVDRIVDLTCSWPTSCTFGGPDLDTLYVTSARFTMTEQHLAAHPTEGGLFAFEPGVRGRPEPQFTG